MDKDTDLERLRAWLATYPGYDILGNMLVDYIDEIPGAASLMPAGLVEINRTEDILGNITAQNQYNFGLYLALEKSPRGRYRIGLQRRMGTGFPALGAGPERGARRPHLRQHRSAGRDHQGPERRAAGHRRKRRCGVHCAAVGRIQNEI